MNKQEVTELANQELKRYSGSLPPNTLTNADGTPYVAGHDAEMKRFLVKRQDGSFVTEGVIFSDGTIVIHGGGFVVSSIDETTLKHMFPNSIIQRLD